MHISRYRTVSQHFADKTGLHCEFMHDIATLFLRIDKKIYKSDRKEDGDYTAEEVIRIFENIIEEKT